MPVEFVGRMDECLGKLWMGGVLVDGQATSRADLTKPEPPPMTHVMPTQELAAARQGRAPILKPSQQKK
jgi:hypothetical protein